uniref:(northern house mosquito) hypothetical protein n=1 Tax=Culex pipiens TaxID=7175 RepID=A0A8D8AV09_CULPI
MTSSFLLELTTKHCSAILTGLLVGADLARAMTSADVLLFRIDCPDLRNQIQLREPTRQLRHTPSIEVPFHRTNYSANGAINGLKRAFNKVSSVFSSNVSRTTLGLKLVCLLRTLLHLSFSFKCIIGAKISVC